MLAFGSICDVSRDDEGETRGANCNTLAPSTSEKSIRETQIRAYVDKLMRESALRVEKLKALHEVWPRIVHRIACETLNDMNLD